MHFQWGRKPIPAKGDAVYHQHAGGGPSHGHKEHAQNLVKIVHACGSGDMRIVNGEEKPFPAIRDAAYRQRARGGPSHGHRQYAQKFDKDRACDSGDILADRQTHRQTYSSQYFATAPAGEVNNILSGYQLGFNYQRIIGTTTRRLNYENALTLGRTNHFPSSCDLEI